MAAGMRDQQLVCITCWKWYTGRTVCPSCKSALVDPETGQPASSGPATAAHPPAPTVRPLPGVPTLGSPGELPPVLGYPGGAAASHLTVSDYLARGAAPAAAAPSFAGSAIADAPPAAAPAWPAAPPAPPSQPAAAQPPVSSAPAGSPPTPAWPAPPPPPPPAPLPPTWPHSDERAAPPPPPQAARYAPPPSAPATFTTPTRPPMRRFDPDFSDGEALDWPAPGDEPDPGSLAAPLSLAAFSTKSPTAETAAPSQAPPAPPPAATGTGPAELGLLSGRAGLAAGPVPAPVSPPKVASSPAPEPTTAPESPTAAGSPAAGVEESSALSGGPGWSVRGTRSADGTLPSLASATAAAEPAPAAAKPDEAAARSQSSSRLVVGTAAALLAGIVIAALWVAAVVATNLQLPYLAVVVGAACGLAARRWSRPGGIAALATALVAVISIGLGMICVALALYAHDLGSTFISSLGQLGSSFISHLESETGELGAALGVAGVLLAVLVAGIPSRARRS